MILSVYGVCWLYWVCRVDKVCTVQDSGKPRPVDRYQVLDPAKLRISGHDGGVHAYTAPRRESTRVGNREAAFEGDGLGNMSEGVCYALN